LTPNDRDKSASIRQKDAKKWMRAGRALSSKNRVKLRHVYRAESGFALIEDSILFNVFKRSSTGRVLEQITTGISEFLGSLKKSILCLDGRSMASPISPTPIPKSLCILELFRFRPLSRIFARVISFLLLTASHSFTNSVSPSSNASLLFPHDAHLYVAILLNNQFLRKTHFEE
jgi:hypothetical protein